MSAERWILLFSWIVTITLLVLFVPKNKIAIANIAFLFKQVMTWLLGLSVAQFEYIEYPVRLFYKATTSSFSFEYFIYPAICAIFIVNFPKHRNLFHRFLYYASFSTAITIFEVILERNTELINYLHWTWHITWLTLFITFYFSRIYTNWFYKRFINELKASNRIK